MRGTELAYGATSASALLNLIAPFSPHDGGMSYAMHGTDIAYGGICYALRGTDIAYGGICYTMPSTDIPGGGICYAMSGTDIPYSYGVVGIRAMRSPVSRWVIWVSSATCLRACYAMSATELEHACVSAYARAMRRAVLKPLRGMQY
eukprot:2325194-Rhodomonas_salina.1